MANIIGRENELTTLRALQSSEKSEFVAVYGRRRVGKTFLVRTAFEGQFVFQVTGLGNANLSKQLTNFHIALQKAYKNTSISQATDWLTAFQQLISYLENNENPKKYIFIDELPWFDTPNSGFIQALEHFWNSWASSRNDIVLIVCGSAASWMLNKLINNKGGLHNRVTKRLKVVPFTLTECEMFLRNKHSVLDKYQIIQLYMVMGGIPYYWEEVSSSLSASQNIEQICFSENGLLRTEFSNLYSSLFKNSEKHISIVNCLAQKAKGLTRDDILKTTKLTNAGSTTRILDELEESGFIRKYLPFGNKNKNSLYQLVDFYTLFYLKFINGTQTIDQNHWINTIDNTKHRAWSGYAFEQVCLYHIQGIKQALGISGIQTATSAWRSSNAENGSQVDLVIDRRDQVINLCEMKYSINPFIIDKKYANELQHKIGTFKTETKTRKSVFLTLITTFGVQTNNYSAGLVQNSLTMDCLF
ncbi:ATP-binding protein [Arcicella sp. DC2W]|uniref:ATP-binding protein n=1 Tax=Arcicella gelida TaxID=2984195 RepID=A0ABU5SBK9_9BACT|nr:ATP-binding protein [Arcicella sp. DC2W]MEA5405814.1 ATP-binding protein [Arcicella sp. DC2W]